MPRTWLEVLFRGVLSNSRIATEHPSRPVVRVVTASYRLIQHRQLRLAKRFDGRHALLPQVGIELRHQLPGHGVIHLPEAGHYRVRPGQVESPLETKDPFATGHCPQPGLARRQHDQFQVLQRQAGDRLGGKDSEIFVHRPIDFGGWPIGPGQDQS